MVSKKYNPYFSYISWSWNNYWLYGEFIGALLIFTAYIFEILTGMKLKDDLREISREWSLVFITGISIFVLSMPLLLYGTYLALIPMVGDAIKTVEIYFLYKKLE
jgi:low affinity Fe/Cu permease